jgi:integrase/recombinase XerC
MPPAPCADLLPDLLPGTAELRAAAAAWLAELERERRFSANTVEAYGRFRTRA